MSDTILVRGLEFLAYHGVYPEERRDGRNFSVDIDAEVSIAPAGQSDDLADTVDYRDLCRIVLEVAQGPSVLLIEKLAEDICGRLLGEIGALKSVRLTIRKFATGVPGEPRWVGLQVYRQR